VFKVSLREVFLIVTLAAVGLAWWLDRSHLSFEDARHKEALMKLRRMGLDVGAVMNIPELSSELNAEYEAENARRTAARNRAASALSRRW